MPNGCVQFQGESGGIAHHYLYRCSFQKTTRGDERVRYPKDSGYGFRTNGNCRGMVFEECIFADNGGYGVQLGGRDIDALTFLRCKITGNGLAAVIGPHAYSALELIDCAVCRNKSDQLPAAKPFAAAAPDCRLRSTRRNPCRSTRHLPLHLARGGREDHRAAVGLRRRHSRSDG